MSQIHFHQDFYETIKKGEKSQTARIGEAVPQLGEGEAIFTDLPSIKIEITKVSHKNFDCLSVEEAQKDGFESKVELWAVLLGFYPQLKTSDLLMLIEFRRV